MAPRQGGVGIGAADRPQCGGRGEHDVHPVLLDQPPVGSRIRRSDRFAFEQNRGGAHQQRGVDDIGMADHPADIGGGQHDLAAGYVVDVAHRPGQRHGVAAVVAHHALRFPGGPGGIEDIERIGRGHRYRIGRFRVVDHILPVQPAGGDGRTGVGQGFGGRLRGGETDGGEAFALFDHHGARGGGLHLIEGLQHDRRIFQALVRFQAAGGGHDENRFGIVDAGGEFVCGEAAENHRVHRADARTGQHGDHGLGNHRHVDHDPVTGAHTEPEHGPGELRHLGQEFGVGVDDCGARHSGVVY